MNIDELQLELRRFAAERGWEPFHTPKNLATALMVEAAELAEIFQWQTAEESQATAADAVRTERVGEECADVLLCLLQVADHCGVDLERAVRKKLARNAARHPPTKPGAPAAARAAPLSRTHVLVDWENVQPSDAALRAQVPGASDVWLFHGPRQKSPRAKFASFGDRATDIACPRTGKSALDMLLSFYVGYLASRHAQDRFVVMSNDQGYAPMLAHASQELGFGSELIEFDRGRAKAVRSSAAKAPARRPAAKKAAAKKTAAPAATEAAPAPVARKAPAARKAAAPKATAPRARTRTVDVDLSFPDAAPPAAKAPAAKKVASAKAPPARKATPARSPRPASPPPAPPATPTRAAPADGLSRDLTKVRKHMAKWKPEQQPKRLRKLLAAVAQWVDAAPDDPRTTAVIDRLADDGAIEIEAGDTVRYRRSR